MRDYADLIVELVRVFFIHPALAFELGEEGGGQDEAVKAVRHLELVNDVGPQNCSLSRLQVSKFDREAFVLLFAFCENSDITTCDRVIISFLSSLLLCDLGVDDFVADTSLEVHQD